MNPPPIIIKVGGALLDDTEAANTLFAHIADIQSRQPVVLVHGGGPAVEQLMRALKLPSNKLDGLRVTPDEHMPYIGGALAGYANKALCALAHRNGLVPVGLSLLDGNLADCQELDEKYGAVGAAFAGDPALLEVLLSRDYIPVISSIGCTKNGRLLNINADQAATVIAELLHGDLWLLSNVDGVLDSHGALLPALNNHQLAQLYHDHTITDGMRVKTDAAVQAANTLGKPVSIANWSAPLTDILRHHAGTRIYPDAHTLGDQL